MTAPDPLEARIEALARDLGAAAAASGTVVATAESCTGGWVAAAITSVAGSSEWFDRGFVTYSNAAKQELLGVPEATLTAHGAVSEAVAAAMVAGALARSRADVAVAVTGVAGPGGGSAGKPVGTVCLGWGRRGAPVATERCRFDGDRAGIRRQAVVHALARLGELARGGAGR